jgi:hypothetical protein
MISRTVDVLITWAICAVVYYHETLNYFTYARGGFRIKICTVQFTSYMNKEQYIFSRRNAVSRMYPVRASLLAGINKKFLNFGMGNM